MIGGWVNPEMAHVSENYNKNADSSLILAKN